MTVGKQAGFSLQAFPNHTWAVSKSRMFQISSLHIPAPHLTTVFVQWRSNSTIKQLGIRETETGMGKIHPNPLPPGPEVLISVGVLEDSGVPFPESLCCPSRLGGRLSLECYGETLASGYPGFCAGLPHMFSKYSGCSHWGHGPQEPGWNPGADLAGRSLRIGAGCCGQLAPLP